MSLVLLIERGYPLKCQKTFASSMITIEQGNLLNQTHTHTVEEQMVPAKHRDIEVLNADDEFNCANEEENGDFNIPGMLNSTVKRSHGINVHSLIERIENHPQRKVLEDDLQPQHRLFVLFQQRITSSD